MGKWLLKHKFVEEHEQELEFNEKPIEPPKVDTSVSPERFQYYKSLRIYKQFSCLEFLNKLWINRYCCYPYLIDQSPRLLALCKKILGENLTFSLVNKTISKVFTGGEDLINLEKQVHILNKQGIGAILNLSEECVEGVKPTNEYMDQCTETICDMFEIAKKTDLNIVAIKMSGLIDPVLLDKVNKG